MDDTNAIYPQWFAAMTKPCMEFKADANLRDQGFWTWLPHERVRRKRWSPKKRCYIIDRADEAYFPRYLFVALRSETDSIYAVNETDGISTVVHLGEDPLPIPNAVMDELMSRADVTGLIGEVDKTTRKRFSPGDQVRFVDESPFAGLVGIVDIDKGPNTRIWLEMLGKDRPILVPPSTIIAAR